MYTNPNNIHQHHNTNNTVIIHNDNNYSPYDSPPNRIKKNKLQLFLNKLALRNYYNKFCKLWIW